MNVMCKHVDGMKGCCGRGSHGALQLATSCPCGDSFSFHAEMTGMHAGAQALASRHARHSPWGFLQEAT